MCRRTYTTERGKDMTVTLTSEQIVIDRIKVSKDRKPDEEIVRQLMISIPVVGVLQPIVLCRPSPGMGINLVFGINRLTACKRLKHRAILSRVANGNTEEIAAWCKQAQLDENAIRAIGAISGPVVSLDAWKGAVRRA